MWGKKDSPVKLDYSSAVERLKGAGFTVSDRSGHTSIAKYNCGAALEMSPSGEPQFAVRPGLMVSQGIAHLLDRGFQKVWQIGDRNIPATAAQLKALHSFEQDLDAAMGVTRIYNQGLGTVSARYVYDRVEGREGTKIHQSFD